jgi:hypothetical protein
MDAFKTFLLGAIAMGHVVAGLFFLRFYFRVGDRLFLMFCGAFWLLGSIRMAMVFIDPREHNFLYWIRFIAYLLILLAIVDKNFPRTSEETPPGPESAGEPPPK